MLWFILFVWCWGFIFFWSVFSCCIFYLFFVFSIYEYFSNCCNDCIDKLKELFFGEIFVEGCKKCCCCDGKVDSY